MTDINGSTSRNRRVRVRVAGRSVRMAVARWAVLAGLAGVVVGGLGVGVAVGTPEEDCQAVRDRDHQIWLQIVASLPPGAPIPPEPVNPCIAEDPSRAPGAEGGSIVDVPGTDLGTGEGRGPQVGTNAPGRIGDGATDKVIVDVPGAGGGGEGPGAGAGEPAPGSGEQAPTGPDGEAEPAVPGPADTGDDTSVVAEDGDEDDRGEAVPGRIERTPAPAAVDPGSAGDGTENPGGKLWLLLTGLAGAGAGAARFGRGRAPWAGKTGYVTIPKLFGEQTLFLMADEDSDRTHRFDQPVPEGGRIEVLDDESAVIVDADGTVVATVAPPWAFDAQGRRVRTWYTVSEDGQALIQHVEPGEDAIFPIIADPEYTDEQRAEDMKIAQINPSVIMPPDANAEYQEAVNLQSEAQDRLADHPEPIDSSQGSAKIVDPYRPWASNAGDHVDGGADIEDRSTVDDPVHFGILGLKPGESATLPSGTTVSNARESDDNWNVEDVATFSPKDSDPYEIRVLNERDFIVGERRLVGEDGLTTRQVGLPDKSTIVISEFSGDPPHSESSDDFSGYTMREYYDDEGKFQYAEIERHPVDPLDEPVFSYYDINGEAEKDEETIQAYSGVMLNNRMNYLGEFGGAASALSSAEGGIETAVSLDEDNYSNRGRHSNLRPGQDYLTNSQKAALGHASRGMRALGPIGSGLSLIADVNSGKDPVQALAGAGGAAAGGFAGAKIGAIVGTSLGGPIGGIVGGVLGGIGGGIGGGILGEKSVGG